MRARKGDPLNKFHGKNSRFLQIPVQTDEGNALYEVPADYADESIRISESKAIGKVAAFLKGCEGIEFLNQEVMPESPVSLEDQRYLKRWDLDYLSLREGDDPPPR